MTTLRKLTFTAPRQVEIREELLPVLKPDEVLVETSLSAISPGTEMLVYRGEFPQIALDPNIESLSGKFQYPLSYGYACVGKVIVCGSKTNSEWLNRQVFSFQPHGSHFITTPNLLFSLPDGLSPETAAFLPNMETAVNLVQDGAPILGERVLVLGQGIVGLLTTALLAEFPLETLISADYYPLRREAGLAAGANAAFDPATADFHQQVRALLKSGADLTFELSGAPAALNDAIALTTFSGRILIGSWYGEKRAELNLGGAFHRSRIKLIASQVSNIAPELSARWDKPRRFDVAWNALCRICPEKWITHRFAFTDAAAAYMLIDKLPQETIQVILDYG
jgi:2-desacetyl-2-hydroxyethyl bacteriochlorophyllide A dehydrogenase